MWKIRFIAFLTASLQRKLMLALMAVAAAVMGVGGIYMLSNQQQSAQAGLEERAALITGMLSKNLAKHLWDMDLKAIQEKLDMVMSDSEIYSVALYEGKQKQPLATRKRDGEVVDGIERDAPVIYTRDQPLPTVELGRVRVVYTSRYIYQALGQTRMLILEGILVLLLSLSAAIYILLRRMVQKPVGALLTMVNRITEGDLEVKIPVVSRDEIGLLSENFNNMAGKLKQTIDVLGKSEARFKSLLQSVQSVALQGYALDGTTQYWNQASEQFYGYTAAEAIGRNLLDLIIPPEMRVDVEQTMRQMAETGQPIPAAELSLMRKDGSRLSVYSSHAIVNVPGQAPELFCIDIDMTDRKQAERDRVARAVAEKANQGKSAFVANMSHEIRTPMNAVIGFAQVLERDPALTPQQAEHVRTIHRSGIHLLRLINDILDMSKIEAGRATLNETAFCLHDLLDDILLMFRARTDAQGLQLLMERDDSVPRYVTADEGKLRQVLVNLLGNAVKFTVTGGVAVRVRAEAVEGKTGAENESLRLRVEVEDSGPGIPDEDIDRIFDLFQQAGAGVKVGGTGLGLAISRRFVEMMGGELTVKSQVGTGSCFRFDLLLKSAAEVARREKRASRRIIGLEPGTGPVRILAVDDAPTNRALLCALLRPLGFEVAEAENGVEALDIFAEWSPQAVLMDMRMPVMDGYEATRQIKATEAGSKTPVIAITASVFEDKKEQVMATGVDAYIRKPFRMEEICEVLGKHLGLRYAFADGNDKIVGDPAPTPLSPSARLALPQEIIQAMQQALEKGESTRLRGLITEVEKLDSATARGLQALLERYDYEKLGQWLATS